MKSMINLTVAMVGLLIFIIFGLRTASDFGFDFKFKIPLPFGEISKTTQENFVGGKGGNAIASGTNSTAIGGPGGGGGPGGAGGNGGDAQAIGDNSFAAGGEGGEAGQIDRGGKGGRSGYEAAGLPNFQLPDGTWMYDYGRGGDGADPQAKE